MICIIQSMLPKCVLAPVTPRGPKVDSHCALWALHSEPPPKPAPSFRQLAMGTLAHGRIFDSSASYESSSVSSQFWIEEKSESCPLHCFHFYVASS